MRRRCHLGKIRIPAKGKLWRFRHMTLGDILGKSFSEFYHWFYLPVLSRIIHTVETVYQLTFANHFQVKADRLISDESPPNDQKSWHHLRV